MIDDVLNNRAAVLSLDADNIELGAQCRALLSDIQDSDDYTLTEEALEQLNALKEELQAQRELLADTKVEIELLKESYKQNRLERDYDNMILVLEDIIDVQENRIAVKTEINGLLEQTLEILEA